ncbi:MAG: LppX_LprAFG lipoprotein [Thermomicrobiales bacterium]
MSATDILERASARIADTESLSFALDVEGPTYVDSAETMQLLEATGELVRPDSVHSRFKVKVLDSVTITMEIITVGDETWATDLITGNWGEAPVEFMYNPSILFDADDGVGPVMERVTGEKRLEDSEIRDRDVFHVQAEVEPDVIGPLTANTLTGAPITVELWIDQTTFELLRAKLAESTTDEEDPSVWILDLDDHGKSFEIAPPDSGS